ncbi:Mov34/MPN/PAD-1 family protein [Planomicrobium sp. CPCC 101079]|uniref:Mov34/MPN/PAD-1 family protein n=1 Tax=Planomicrobium sp. CPCC 101079 TaxID=2599618 RepID=UPI0011B60F49|nr:Mov34/MPN/PAD-1 family protein [Planomicrobium sp. CPCC 101079]TWT01859.1 hypothetical protein FQV28_14600 [Planomicrobium sp. CPCC 101079]
MNKLFKYTCAHSEIEITILSSQILKLQELCNLSFPNETGGILIGSYSPNQKTANIILITAPPTDSKSSPNTFIRGVKGLQQQLNIEWELNGNYYLGEWHFHPNGSKYPSSIDKNEMKKISLAKEYNCPEPILMIVNGKTNEINISPYVFFRNGSFASFS